MNFPPGEVQRGCALVANQPKHVVCPLPLRVGNSLLEKGLQCAEQRWRIQHADHARPAATAYAELAVVGEADAGERMVGGEVQLESLQPMSFCHIHQPA